MFLTQIIYAIVLSLSNFTDTIAHDDGRPYTTRERLVRRLNSLLQDFLALTARIDPTRVGPAAFGRLRPTPTPAKPASPRPPHTPSPPNPLRAKPLLSARQLARRFAALLQRLDDIIRDLAQDIPEAIVTLCLEARTIIGNPFPPRPIPAWETLDL